jgi:hypothetical protein
VCQCVSVCLFVSFHDPPLSFCLFLAISVKILHLLFCFVCISLCLYIAASCYFIALSVYVFASSLFRSIPLSPCLSFSLSLSLSLFLCLCSSRSLRFSVCLLLCLRLSVSHFVLSLSVFRSVSISVSVRAIILSKERDKITSFKTLFFFNSVFYICSLRQV